MMTTKAKGRSIPTSTEPVRLVRWIFRRGDNHLTCQVDLHSNRSTCDVSVVPHWDVTSAVVEAASSPRMALQRHARIAMELLDTGWSVAARSI